MYLKRFTCMVFVLVILLACSVVVSATIISKEIKSSSQMLSEKLSDMGSELLLSQTYEEDDEDILSMYDATLYLKINEADLESMIEQGLLQGTYFKKPDGNYLFVREKLYQWCLQQTE